MNSLRQLPDSEFNGTEELAPGDAIFRELFEGAPIGMALLALGGEAIVGQAHRLPGTREARSPRRPLALQ